MRVQTHPTGGLRGAVCRAAAALFLACVVVQPGRALAEPVTFAAQDGVVVHADYRLAAKGGAGVIVLFHQAGTNLHEYDPIAPMLNALGFDTLAVDQRAGGKAFGHRNETAAGAGGAADYLDAYPDMEAALAWAKAQQAGGRAAPVIVWGSSYSSSLAFRLAAEHPGAVAAVLSFSPGEYFGGQSYVRNFAARVRVPVFVTSASDGGEVAAAAGIAGAVPGGRATVFVPERGTHGSASLRQDTNPRGAEAIWAAVTTFLHAIPAA